MQLQRLQEQRQQAQLASFKLPQMGCVPSKTLLGRC
jgi:hypothetical protein